MQESFERDPYPEEHPTRRGYVWARRPFSAAQASQGVPEGSPKSSTSQTDP